LVGSKVVPLSACMHHTGSDTTHATHIQMRDVTLTVLDLGRDLVYGQCSASLALVLHQPSCLPGAWSKAFSLHRTCEGVATRVV